MHVNEEMVIVCRAENSLCRRRTHGGGCEREGERETLVV